MQWISDITNSKVKARNIDFTQINLHQQPSEFEEIKNLFTLKFRYIESLLQHSGVNSLCRDSSLGHHPIKIRLEIRKHV